MNSREHQFIEDLGLLIEKSGGTRTLGRVFGYLLIVGKPKNLDEIAKDLLFSKATASLTIRQGLSARFFEKVSILGERKDSYRANTKAWISSMSDRVNEMTEWQKVFDYGLSLLTPDNRTAMENLKGMKDYFDFMLWYLSDIDEQYELWKKGREQ